MIFAHGNFCRITAMESHMLKMRVWEQTCTCKLRKFEGSKCPNAMLVVNMQTENDEIENGSVLEIPNARALFRDAFSSGQELVGTVLATGEK